MAICAGLALAPPGTLPAQAQRAPTAARCPHPARIENTLDPAAPSVILTIRHEANLQPVAARLSRGYGVQPQGLRIIHSLVLTAVSAELVERLRCEPDIELVTYSVPLHTN